MSIVEYFFRGERHVGDVDVPVTVDGKSQSKKIPLVATYAHIGEPTFFIGRVQVYLSEAHQKTLDPETRIDVNKLNKIIFKGYEHRVFIRTDRGLDKFPIFHYADDYKKHGNIEFEPRTAVQITDCDRRIGFNDEDQRELEDLHLYHAGKMSLEEFKSRWHLQKSGMKNPRDRDFVIDQQKRMDEQLD